MGFDVALSNVLVTLFYIIPGFIICKIKKASADHLPTLSAVLIYVCGPCMTISAFLALDFSWRDLANMGIFFVATFLLQAAFMGLIFLLFRKKSGESKYRILALGSVMGNVGFFGLPIVKALIPDNPEVMCYAAVYVISMNILVFTVGVFCLTGKKETMTLRAAIFNPSMFGFVVGLALYLLSANRYMPTLLVSGLGLLGNMTTPLCMIILGIRLATVRFGRLFTRPIVYGTCLCKLLLYPLFCYAAVVLLPLDPAFKAAILILSATPCASIIFNMAEIHRSETELSANCVLVSTLLCFITIPILTLIL